MFSSSMSAPSEVSVAWGWRSKWRPKKASLRGMGAERGKTKADSPRLAAGAGRSVFPQEESRTAAPTARLRNRRAFVEDIGHLPNKGLRHVPRGHVSG
ncbi:MAG: hypothetical protein A2W20_06030 [Candidatus Aminicenantes bacterium RBG_16_66_30]|nr:MAG: hypothetical protein A2W20_06030 [Candidatus Aminicenantes bacterium RBG_16_66_30]